MIIFRIKPNNMREENKFTYVVTEKRPEAPGVATLSLTVPEWHLPAFIPGQYISVYFPQAGTPEGKAYSISSAPHEGLFNITVRGIGEFSNRLVAAKPGDTILGSQPYGYFYSEAVDTPLVLVAAGIGITPFRSITLETLKRQPGRKLFLFHSSRSLADTVFKKEFDALAMVHPHFKRAHFITRETVPGEHIFPERISAEKVLEIVGKPRKGEPAPEYMLCGPISFTRDLWRGFRALGVPEDSLYTEAFFSH